MNRMILLAGLSIPGLVSAQSSSTGGAPDRVEIEVATVKQNKGGGGQNIQLTPGGQINITNIPLRTLIRIAYGTDAIQTMAQVVGGPGWFDTEPFDLVAKTTVAPSPRADIFPVMVRSVLEDRFQIKVNTEGGTSNQKLTPVRLKTDTPHGISGRLESRTAATSLTM